MSLNFGNGLLASGGFEEFWNDLLNEAGNGNKTLGLAILIVGAVIVLVALVSLTVSIVLGVKYYRFNRKENSAGLTGVEAARKILDANDLQHIKVKAVGSLIFGNSYSHYFKKVRLRRMTKNKKSVTALAMGVQKSALAVLDKEGDPAMKLRVRLIPIITFGPIAFVPLIVIGVLLDFLVLKTDGWVTITFAAVGVVIYLLSFLCSLMTLKTEKRAQERAYELLRENNMATEEEIGDIRRLFRLYNIQYINDLILSALELLYYVLEIVAGASGGYGGGSSND